jgi:serine/threonine protein phosphatase PrpC
VIDFFRKLFGLKGTSSSENVVTAPLSDAQLQAIRAVQAHVEPSQLLVGVGQSVGKQRELNEDSLFTFTTNMAGHFGSQPFGLFIIADGMGGHQYGEVASNSAIRTMAGFIMRKFHSYLFNLPTSPVDESLQEIMQGAVAEAQRVVLREAPGSGTTLTAALVIGQQITIGHVGDSRAYLVYNDGRTDVVTRDHSLVKRLEELGQITSSEAAVHPQRNVLYRALGQGEVLEPDIVTTPFPQQGYLLLCSDGLWGVVPEDLIRQTILESNNLTRACQSLIAAANTAGGPDNISAILVQLLS